MKKTIYLFLLLLLVPRIIYSQESITQHTVDSLLNVIKHAEGRDKILAYYSLTNLPFKNSDILLQYLDEFQREASKLGDTKYECVARERKLTLFYNNYMEDMFDKEVDEHMQFMREHKDWSNYFSCYYLKNSNLIHSNRMEEALKGTSKMYNEAKKTGDEFGKGLSLFSIGLIYYLTDRYDEAEQPLRESLKIFCDLDEISYMNIVVEKIGDLLNKFGRNQEYIELLLQSEVVIKEFEKTKGMLNVDMVLGTYQNYYISLSSAYLEINNCEKARQYLNEADKYTKMLPDYYKRNQYIYEITVLEQCDKNYEKALQLIEEANEYFNKINEYNGITELMKSKAKILCKIGRAEEGVTLFIKYESRKDSIQNKELAAQLDEIRTVYEVDKLELQAKEHRNLIFGLVVICVLLALSGSIVYFYSHRLRAKNRMLFMQINQQDKMEEVIEKQMVHVIKDISDAESHRNNNLFIAFKELIKDEKIFTNTEIDRKTIACMLGTNEKYLFDAIKENTGISFYEYIMSLRLKYAKKMLLENNNLTMDDIAHHSGFSSSRTFYRNFREKYKLSPAEFRKAASIIT